MMSVVIASGVGHCTEVKLKLCGVCVGASRPWVFCVLRVCACVRVTDKLIGASIHMHVLRQCADNPSLQTTLC